MALEFSQLPIEQKKLHVPSIETVRDVLQRDLANNFNQVNVEVVNCPDLTQAPFHLSKGGLGGNPVIVDIGGPPYLLPLVQREKVYDLKKLPSALQMHSALIIGAGAGPFPWAGKNCEGIYNLYVDEDNVKQQSVIGILNKTPKGYEQQTLPSSETRCALLANVFVSEGISGKVLKVHVKERKGDRDFVSSMRSALQNYFQEKPVGLGGTFVINNGKVKQHIMDDFSSTPLNSDDDVNNWLHFYEMSTPIVSVGVLISHDPDLDLRVQHFHSFSDHNEAGHYHIDTTPKDIEYVGYFNLADKIYRIDRPSNTHLLGRD